MRIPIIIAELFINGEISYSSYAKLLEQYYNVTDKQLNCFYNQEGLYCSKGLVGTKCSLDGCVAWRNKDEYPLTPDECIKNLEE